MHRVTLSNSVRTANRLSRLTSLSKSLENGRSGVLASNQQSAALLQPATRLLTSTTPPSASAVAARVAQEPFLNGSSSVYVEEMYNAWLEDPKSVHKSWDVFFRNATNDAAPGAAHQKPPSLFPFAGSVGVSGAGSAVGFSQPRAVTSDSAHQDIHDHLSVQAIIRSYQVCYSFVFLLFTLLRSHMKVPAICLIIYVYEMFVFSYLFLDSFHFSLNTFP